MTATIHFIGIDSESFARFREVIRQETEPLTNAWIVSVNSEAQANDLWQVAIEYAGQPIKSATFDGAVGDHDPEAFRHKLRRMLRLFGTLEMKKVERPNLGSEHGSRNWASSRLKNSTP